MTDDEYLWLPVPGAWSLRSRGEGASMQPYGPGHWQLDFQFEAPDPPPVTTIAWRLGHLTSGIAGRWEGTFGARQRPPPEAPNWPRLVTEWWSRRA